MDEGDPVKKEDNKSNKEEDQIQKSKVDNEQGEDEKEEKDEVQIAKGNVQSQKDEAPDEEVNTEQKDTPV